MASIFGLRLKGRTTFRGMDWQGNKGDLYLGNVKVAWYNDSGNGGAADIEFYNGRPGRDEYAPKLNELVKKYYEKYPLEGEYKTLEPDVDMLIGRLLELMDDEKQYKKFAKQGYPIMIVYKTAENGRSYYGAYRTRESADAHILNEKFIVLQRYERLSDFHIMQ